MDESRPKLNAKQKQFIAEQKMFFVATAPLADDGLINLSPKGLDGTFVVLDDQTVAYLDLTGSGVETIAHLNENSRICLMFCAFEGRPNIFRIQGRGEVVLPEHEAFESLLAHFPEQGDGPGVRSVIRIHADRIADSCGYGVPLMEYKEQRTELTDWAEKQGTEGVERYQRNKNRTSLDGLPGLPV
ncbi:pyridoxamine 5'-phosphate oxidase family protein [Algisphaera agarilytica]|uniref:Putative pyridoxine 5'-phosphate oxidase superfamily flavin-nucleotide-binding protein n=1 Tax=Algisphaera agarilytica TaxID=1385975 RepID=A0A7X0H7F7_9BACT|nr:pyridoxamine 5'-phosphate oxidase family protein [Algisphaera agarilytica]MBB6430677.1 putative pyridoxine 5'-phosphate oxidase superfamily flavin-nucleotide-binding protein [Algisphaera agarilytica]